MLTAIKTHVTDDPVTRDNCRTCGGQGRLWLPCQTCKGRGGRCGTCSGQGQVSVICATCRGSGVS